MGLTEAQVRADYWCCVCAYILKVKPDEPVISMRDKVTLVDRGKGAFIDKWEYDDVRMPTMDDLMKAVEAEDVTSARADDMMSCHLHSFYWPILNAVYDRVNETHPDVFNGQPFNDFCKEVIVKTQGR